MLSLVLGLRAHTKRTVLHSVRDMNGDRVADLVTLTLAGRSVLKQRSRFEVHLGAATPLGVSFAAQAGAVVEPEGSAGVRPQDFDGDGLVDLMVTDSSLGFIQMLRGILADSIAMDLEFYRNENGVYPVEPTTRRDIRPDFDPLDEREGAFFPAVLLGDVNGDGRADLIMAKSRNALHVCVGVPGPDLFAKQPVELSLAIPDDEQSSQLVDLNGDGKQDIVMHHPSATGPHRLTVLIAR